MEFPDPIPGRTEVLLSFARAGIGEVLAVHYEAQNRVRLIWERVGMERVASLPQQVEPGRTYRLAIASGGAMAISPWPDRVVIDLGGRALLRLCRPVPAEAVTAASTWRLRENFVGGSLGLVPFRGRIEPAGAWTAADLVAIRGFENRGPIRLHVMLPHDRPGRSDPLLVTGRTGRGDALFITSEEFGRIRFGVDHWGGSGAVGETVVIDPLREHEFWISTDALLPEKLPDAVDEWAAMRGRVVIVADGRTLFSAAVPAHSIARDELFPGENPIGISTCDPVFHGKLRFGAALDMEELRRFREASPVPEEPALTANGTASPGPIELLLVFGAEQPSGRSEPLLATGISGMGDLLFVQFMGDGRARLGIDHWGVPGVVSEPFACPPGQPCKLVVSLSSLLPIVAIGTDPYARLRSRMVLVVNDRVALDVPQAAYPSSPANITLGRNVIGATSADAEFRGRIERIRPAPLSAVP